ncbi:Cell cycle serine/threonine-protein kinase cdc5/MSD2, partial [Mortierella sp. GBA35]
MRRQFSSSSPATISKELSRVPAIFVDDEDYHYSELDFLGAGGFGEVTKVLEEETGDIYALKTMSTKKLKTFENEDAMLQQVGEREDIVELIRAFIYKDRSYMVFGYCPWGDLETFLRMRKILTEEEAIFFTTQVVGAVAAIHKAKVIHRDLKPSNIFLVDGMRIKVGDFGVATAFRERKKEIVGTPGYYAPEVLLGQVHTAAIDVWCVGTMIYQMLAGKLPAHTTKNWVCYNPRFLDKVTMSRSTQKLIRRMLNMSLEARPKTRDLLTWPILNSNALPNSLS